MSSKFINAIRGLQYLPRVFGSLSDNVQVLLKRFKLFKQNLSYKKRFKKYLNCDFKDIATLYCHLGHTHVEILAHNGIFISSSHNLDKIYPRIVVLEPVKNSFTNLEAMLEGSFVGYNWIQHNPANDPPVKFNTPIDSVGLPFVLEQFPDLNSIENMLLAYKEQLDPNKDTIIFGCSAIYGEGKAKLIDKYIELLAQEGQFTTFNKQLTIEELAQLFEKHFHDVTLLQRGACLMFCLQPNKKRIKRKPTFPKDHPLDIPYDTYYE